jgi:hypothetical protein
MIRVSRMNHPVPPALTARRRDGMTERERAVAFYSNRDNAPKKFPFAAYADNAVRLTLNTIFQYKCAYCESVYGATQPVAVEHFRPKAAVEEDERRHKPGYYWLAADWDNLLPTCTDCNTPRYYDFGDGHQRKLGKGNYFPILGRRARPLRPGVETRERRLLLHPCVDVPEKHLEFLDHGLVRGRVGSRKGKMSVEIYGLLRPELVRARKERWLNLNARFQSCAISPTTCWLTRRTKGAGTVSGRRLGQ